MLVVSKKLGESVWLGTEIEVKVLAVRSGSVRLGIEAPQTVDVRRNGPPEGDPAKREEAQGNAKA